MSRARRIAHRHLVYSRKYQRALARRNHECRVRHWRQMLRTMLCTGWQRPMDRFAREAHVIVRCREHRNQVAVTMMIPEAEVRAAHDWGELATQRLRSAIMTIHKRLIPQRYRREFA